MKLITLFFIFIFLISSAILIAEDTLEIYQFIGPELPEKPCSLEIYQFTAPSNPEKPESLEIYTFPEIPQSDKPCSLDIFTFSIPPSPAKHCTLEIYSFTPPSNPDKPCSLEIYTFSIPPLSEKPCSLEIYTFTAPTGSRIEITVEGAPDSTGYYFIDGSPSYNTLTILQWISGSTHRLIAKNYNQYVPSRWFYRFVRWTSSRGEETTDREWNVTPVSETTYTAHYELFPVVRLNDGVWFDTEGNYRGFNLYRP